MQYENRRKVRSAASKIDFSFRVRENMILLIFDKDRTKDRGLLHKEIAMPKKLTI